MTEQIAKSKVEDPELVERRRAQLTAAAIAEFSEKGYHVTTIRDVAERAGVSIGLIYQYVHDKEDLLFLALLDVLESYRRQIPVALEGVVDPLLRFRVAVETYCRVNAASVEATVLAYRETKSLRKERRNIIKQKEVETNEIIAATIRDCIEAGYFVADLDIELFTYQIVTFCHAWALKAWRFRSRMSVDEYLRRGLRLLFTTALTARGERQLREAGALSSAPPQAERTAAE